MSDKDKPDGYYWQLTIKGGPGSGHWGHAGRPGQVGGSVPGNVAVSIATGRTARQRQQEAAALGRMSPMARALTETGRFETTDDDVFSYAYVACRDGDVQPDQFNVDAEWERIQGAKRYGDRFIEENKELVAAIDDDAEYMRPRDSSVNIIFTTDPQDAGWGVSSVGQSGFKVFYVPYDAPKEGEGWPEWKKTEMGIDPLFVTLHELHHVYGSSTEFDLLSDVMAVGYHLELGNNLNPKGVFWTAERWFYGGMQRAAGSDRQYVLKRRAAFKWLMKTHPDYADSILGQWSNADELKKKAKRW